ncbi:MAG: VCBS repeat-containing protein [Planctomycetes bacterium]|nr:VCBS repeat-containing protein [Planctomycetota bacterium]
MRSEAVAIALSALAAPVSAAICQAEFTGGPIFTVGANAGVNALADMDADGHLDLLAGDYIFLGDGRGDVSRKPIRLSPIGYMVFDAMFTDFDLDGYLDVAICQIGDRSVRFLFGQPTVAPGKPAFGTPVSVSTIDMIWHLALGDFVEDGRLDLAAVSMGEPAFSLLINQGDRKFKSEIRGTTTPGGHPVAAADFDGDGHLDLAVGIGDMVSLSFGNGDGKFRKTVSGNLFNPPRTLDAHRFRAGDLDGDGRAELVAACEGYLLIYLGSEIAEIDGFPARASLAPRISGTGRFLAIDDLNGDGLLDVISESTGTVNRAIVQVFFGDRDATTGALKFVAGALIQTTLSGHGSVLAVGDLNEDGAPDLVLTTEDTGNAQIFLNDGACYLRAERGDTNADGILDLGDAISALGYVVSSVPVPCPEAVEVNGDGRLDLADPIYLLLYLYASGPAPKGESPVACHPAS